MIFYYNTYNFEHSRTARLHNGAVSPRHQTLNEEGDAIKQMLFNNMRTGLL